MKFYILELYKCGRHSTSVRPAKIPQLDASETERDKFSRARERG